MSNKPTKLIGKSFADFKNLVRVGKEIHLQTARLIPFYKPGDEMALTSIFMSAMRLIKEFRKNISQAISLTSSGDIHIFSEIEFCEALEPGTPPRTPGFQQEAGTGFSSRTGV